MKFTFNIYLLTILVIFLTFSCGESTKEKQLTETEKGTISAFSKQLLKSFQEFDPSFVKNTWHTEAFRKRITGLNRVQKNVLNYILEEFVNNQIKFGNVALVNQIYEESGNVYHSKLQHYQSHSELTLLIITKESFYFLKYRIELKNNRPVLSDIFDFRDNTWHSESIKNNIALNSKYNAFSEERNQANMAWQGYLKALNRGDTLSAIRKS